MAEPARRNTRTDGPDLVRRLLARPIRLEQDRHEERLAGRLEGRTAPPPAGGRTRGEAPGHDLDPDDALDRAEAELMLTKAVLQAERRETAALRARLDRIGEGTPLDADAEAVRARWSRLVDTLLRAPQ